jgi:DNA-binding protein HU-beta
MKNQHFNSHTTLEPKLCAGFGGGPDEKSGMHNIGKKDPPMSINKQELVSKIADSAKITKTEASTVLDAFIEVVTKSLKKGVEVRLTGFGTFCTVKRKATTGRNPRTGASIKIPASTSPKFRAGKSLRDAVN